MTVYLADNRPIISFNVEMAQLHISITITEIRSAQRLNGKCYSMSSSFLKCRLKQGSIEGLV